MKAEPKVVKCEECEGTGIVLIYDDGTVTHGVCFFCEGMGYINRDEAWLFDEDDEE